MREIKFRAWDKRNKSMIGPYTLRQLDDGEVGLYRSIHPPSGKIIQDFEDLDWLEFTGQFDKEGKEGYADDLVEMFERSLWRIVWDEYHARYQLELVKGDEIRKVFDMGLLQFAKIVGNVYEHPELMPEQG